MACLLYTSDAADEEDSVDLGVCDCVFFVFDFIVLVIEIRQIIYLLGCFGFRKQGAQHLGEAKKVLGREIKRDRRSDNVSLTQKAYLQKVLQRFNIDGDMKSVSTHWLLISS